jgi:hypothetical protein
LRKDELKAVKGKSRANRLKRTKIYFCVAKSLVLRVFGPGKYRQSTTFVGAGQLPGHTQAFVAAILTYCHRRRIPNSELLVQ